MGRKLDQSSNGNGRRLIDRMRAQIVVLIFMMAWRENEVMPMDPEATTAGKLIELPEETREFLSQLREEDIDLMKHGLDLIRSMRTIGRFMRWVILGVLAILIGVVSLYENTVKLIAWFQK